jgi:hypothetical protein
VAAASNFEATVFRRISSALSEHLQRECGLKNGLIGRVTLIQRFGIGANLNVHCRIIAIDGAHKENSTCRLKFYSAKTPTADSIARLVQEIAERVSKRADSPFTQQRQRRQTDSIRKHSCNVSMRTKQNGRTPLKFLQPFLFSN